ncbi:MAG: RnfABCDGE type electron transport complex subunit G [Clostridia bacterium]|nr:RnfABCDGE type electron transport complex subunit G [Clostridia bacterium]
MNKFFDKIKSFFKANGEVITPTAVLAIICVVVTLALSSTNLLTAGKIEALAIETQNKAMAKLIEADEYHELPATTSFGDITYNAAIKDGDTVGCIFVTEANGYGGVVSVMTAVDMEGKIIAVEILAAADETPGLGQNVTKEYFYTRFNGMSGDIIAAKAGTAKKENNEIDAVTGATISSKAVTTAVNQALDYASEIIVKGDELK